MSYFLSKSLPGTSTESAIVIKLLFREMSDFILEGSRVSAKKIMDTVYEFKYPEPEKALTSILKP